MKTNTYDLIIIGGGPAGTAAAVSAWNSGVQSIAVLERDKELGGILNQCIHTGFGLHRFGEELSGPEYAGRYIDLLERTGVETYIGTMAVEIRTNSGYKEIFCFSREMGIFTLRARAVILAMGCRERGRGAVMLPGTRCSGIFCAGTAQRYINMEGYKVGNRVVILGSGDIGLIMARRLTLEGAKVLAVAELMPYSGGLSRNIAQCLEDFDIPLYLSHTVTDIKGDKRLEEVTISRVDEKKKPIPGTEITFSCDTLLLSVGLIPENELSESAGIEIDRRTNGAFVDNDLQTSEEGIFACGNVLHVHDLVDFVSEESERAGKKAAEYLRSEAAKDKRLVAVTAGNGVSYTVPQKAAVGSDEKLDIFFRSNTRYEAVSIMVSCGEEKIASYKREFVLPGEMEKITLPASLAKNINADIVVSIEKRVTE